MARTGRSIPGTTGRRIPGSAGSRFRSNPQHAQFAQRVRQSGRFVSGGSGFVWQGLDVVMGNLTQYGQEMEQAVFDAADEMAEIIQEHMQSEAKWDDRTGDARGGLKAIVVPNRGEATCTIFMGHSVYYGYYLETMQGGRFAIIEPTMRWAESQWGFILTKHTDGISV